MTERSTTAETSVGRALRVIEAVAEAGDGVAAKALARRLGFSLPTTYRLLATLVEEGYLVRLRELRGYGLGYRIGALAHRLADQVAVPWAVRSVLHEVHRAGVGAAYYAVLRGDRVVVAHLDDCPEHPGSPRLRTGEPIPARDTAAGRVLLAGLDRRRCAALDPAGLTPELVCELRRVHEFGVAVVTDEQLPGWSGVAAPVRTGGTVTGALAMSVRRGELNVRRAALEWAVREAAGRAGTALADVGRTAS